MSISDDELKIEAKYNVGERVFYISGGCVCEDRVRAVYKTRWGGIEYGFGQYADNYDDLDFYEEEMVFRTKQSLIKSL